MEVKELSDVNYILRRIICNDKQIKTLQSEQKQLKDRLDQLYEDGKLGGQNEI